MWCVSSPQWLCTDLRYVVLLLLCVANVNVKSVAWRLGSPYGTFLISVYQWKSTSKLLSSLGKKGLIRNTQTDFITAGCHCNWEHWKTQRLDCEVFQGASFWWLMLAQSKDLVRQDLRQSFLEGSIIWAGGNDERTNHLTSAYHRAFCTFQCVSLFWPFRGGMLIHIDCLLEYIHFQGPMNKSLGWVSEKIDHQKKAVFFLHKSLWYAWRQHKCFLNSVEMLPLPVDCSTPNMWYVYFPPTLLALSP